MRNVHYIYALLLMLMTLAVASCSTTSNLPEDEVLYTGIKKITIEDKKNTFEESVALTELNAALAYAPNNSFMGSSSLRMPPPVGLWVYNSFIDRQKLGFSKWLFKTFGSTPVTITSVNPATRVKIAQNTLQNYGYFQGKVDYELVDAGNRKQKIKYNVKLGEPYLFDSIKYVFPLKEDSIIQASIEEARVKEEGQFSVLDLQAEKDRVSELMRDNGFYYYRSDYITLLADSSHNDHKVKLLVVADDQMPDKAHKQYYIGNVSANIYPSTTGGMRSRTFTDSITRRGLTVRYNGKKPPIKPMVMFRNFRFWRRQLYSEDRLEQTITNLSNMGVFQRVQFKYTPRDTLPGNDTLDVHLDAVLDKPIDTQLEFNITQKSNAQVGPYVGILFSKKNAFGRGETLNIGVKGSYEWQMGGRASEKGVNSNSYGLDASISYPWLMVPLIKDKPRKYPTSTMIKLSVDHMDRSNYYGIMSFSAGLDYKFQTSKKWAHVVSPISLKYNKLTSTSERFDSIAGKNKALYISLSDQFVPAVEYKVTYDNTVDPDRRFSTLFELQTKESANMISGFRAMFDRPFSRKGKKLLHTDYSQFFKLVLTLKNNFRLTDKSEIATRLQTGVVYSYGNSVIAPYSELFYVGGANDIRAFAAHTLGPGRYYDYEGRGTYLDQAGDFKLEANVEYRFPLVSNLSGALFLDAGNVWTLRRLDSHPGGQITARHFLKDIAVGTGFGLRYDLEFLILRLDLGVGIHAPYETGKKGYYNISKFKDSVGFHFAVGYPF